MATEFQCARAEECRCKRSQRRNWIWQGRSNAFVQHNAIHQVLDTDDFSANVKFRAREGATAVDSRGPLWLNAPLFDVRLAKAPSLA